VQKGGHWLVLPGKKGRGAKGLIEALLEGPGVGGRAAQGCLGDWWGKALGRWRKPFRKTFGRPRSPDKYGVAKQFRGWGGWEIQDVSRKLKYKWGNQIECQERLKKCRINDYIGTGGHG